MEPAVITDLCRIPGYVHHVDFSHETPFVEVVTFAHGCSVIIAVEMVMLQVL